MIVVSAASGALGRLVVAELLAAVPAGQVVAAVRDPGRAADLAAQGVQVRRGDYDDAASLGDAFDGADRLLLISSPELDTARRTAQHLAAIEAADAAGVERIVYTSFLGADRAGDGMNAAHHATERALVASGPGHTVLRHPFYSDAFVNAGLRSAVDSGRLVSATGGRGLNTASRADLAAAAAAVLTDDGHAGRSYDLTGPLWTYPQLAEELARATGRPVAHQAGDVPGPMGFLMGLARAGALERQTDDLHHLLGRPPTSLRQAVAAALAG
ncbi:NAD(P)H-binding protein [Promicromonospora sukumoe]|uniref:NAD(P)H dehydrogenase (Quinone) n=2 Tax=Promicromonospora sukumoe TaxID=88382 RepID=A0A7W3J6J6_9MICO|nr:NAD(P)H-binding protein [Promicromonospora sukumoe]MBA8807227.1 NAD(P)H dehydrogenase (quinone) [Promicromonospora sukumoe]